MTAVCGTVVFAHDDGSATVETREIVTGGFAMIPAEHPHRATAQGETVIQVPSGRPSELIYLGPADDPRGQSN